MDGGGGRPWHFDISVMFLHLASQRYSRVPLAVRVASTSSIPMEHRLLAMLNDHVVTKLGHVQ